MNRLFVPPLSSKLTLAEDWHFKMFYEGRNEEVLRLARLSPPHRLHGDWYQMPGTKRENIIRESLWRDADGEVPVNGNIGYEDLSIPFVLRQGTALVIERYYVRRGQKKYDSITFRSDCVVSQPGDPMFTAGKFKSVRFWVKLADANNIFFEDTI